MSELLHKDLSYKIVGVCYDVYNKLGYGYKEKYYQRAIAKGFEIENMCYKREYPVNLEYKDERVGKHFLDFIVEDKIIVEVKVYPYFRLKKSHYRQVLGYLKSTGLRLAILVYFTKDGVKFKRIVN